MYIMIYDYQTACTDDKLKRSSMNYTSTCLVYLGSALTPKWIFEGSTFKRVNTLLFETLNAVS